MANEISERDEPLLATAAWMLPAETAARHVYETGDLWLGRNADEERTPIGRDDDSHVLLCAKTRSGKGRGLITNNLLLWPGSVFVNDPKGENASVTAARRGQGSAHAREYLDQKVCVLDSHGTADVDDSYRAYYNPLAEITPDDPDAETKAALIAEGCVSSHQKNDVTWDNKAKTYIKMLALHIVSDRLIPDDQRDLITLRRFIVAGDQLAVAYEREHADPETLKANPPDGFTMLLEAMMENRAFGGVIADQAVSLMESFRSQPKMWNSIRTSAEEHTDWIDDRRMREVLRPGRYKTTFKAKKLQSRKGGLSVYVCLPSSHKETFAAWPRILVNMILAAAQARGNQHPATGHQTLMMLDEFASMERMKKIEGAAADIAGAGVKMFFVVQSLTQLKAVYGENWETFASSADTHIYYGFNDNFTAEYVSKRLGEVEVVRTTQSGSTAMNEATSSAEMTGGSDSTAFNESTAIGRGRSSGSNSGRSSGSSDSTGWGPSIFFRTLETTNQEARQRGRSHGTSRQKSYQKTKTKGRTDTEGRQWSNTTNRTQGRTDTEGFQQSIHKKPLAAINELMQLFGTIEDESELNFPGIGLISTASQRPMLIQKIYYDQDRYFEGLFDPHPKHGFTPIPIAAPEILEHIDDEPSNLPNVLIKYEGHEDTISSFALCDRSQHMVSCDEGGSIISWDVKTGTQISRIHQPSTKLKITPDQKHVAALSYNEISFLDINSLNLLHSMKVSNSESHDFALSNDGKYIAVGSGESGFGEYLVRIFSIEDQKIVSELHHTGVVYTVQYAKDDSYIFTGCVYDSGRIWTFTPKNNSRLSSLFGGLSGSSYRSDADVVFTEQDGGVFSSDLYFPLSIVATGPAAAGHYPNPVRIWNVRSGENIKTLEGHNRPIDDLCFSFDGKFLISSSQDFTFRIWHASTGEQVYLIDQNHRGSNSVALSGRQSARFYGSTYNAISTWDNNDLVMWDISSLI